MTTYADLTYGDRNRLKRWIQHRRLFTAAALAAELDLPADPTFIDFGAGNGELCKVLAGQYSRAKLACYEIAAVFLNEARENLAGLPVSFYARAKDVPHASADVLFCLEVFEHLPPADMERGFDEIVAILKPGGYAIIGVPIEIGLTALAKGVFRMLRNYGAYDATIVNVLRAAAGVPPQNRPTHEIVPGHGYYSHHMGFDHRRFRRELDKHLTLQRTHCSPFPLLGAFANSEIYFVAQKSPRQ